jgi:dihydrofolate reductase
MRNLIYAINITVDGCADHRKQTPNEETLEYFTQLLQDVDLQVFGRITYQLMVPYWPDAEKDPSSNKSEIDFARAFNSTSKLVFSRSLRSAEDKNTRIVSGNLKDEILKLKQQPGKSILAGGINVPSQLIELGLLDEYRLVVNPVLAGVGPHVLAGVNLTERLKLKFLDSKTFKSGCIVLRYSK